MNLLVVDDDELSRSSVQEFLSDQMGYKVCAADNGMQALELFRSETFEVVISDLKMPVMGGIDLLREVKKLAPQTDVIIMTGYADVETSVAALRLGATDYLLKPFEVEDLAQVIQRIEDFKRLQHENAELKDTLKTKDEAEKESKAQMNALRSALRQVTHGPDIAFFSSSMHSIVSLCQKLHHERDVPVLIEGETGTGKEVIAKLIHNGEKENEERPFIPLNCAAISPQLFESELFGYVEGAFTGARKNGAAGKLELAQGGTIFLDEIGELPLEFQPKLLRVLQEREIYRVGGDKPISLDVRFIFATNRNLKSMSEKKEFRSDLYYRMNLGSIEVPPLRERKEAIVPLAQLFLERFAAKRNRDFRFITGEARKILMQYKWPGNIRELQHTIERIVLLYNEEYLEQEHLAFLQEGHEDGIAQRGGHMLEQGKIQLPDTHLSLREIENEILLKSLRKFDNNKTKAAEYLGLTRSAFRSRLDRI